MVLCVCLNVVVLFFERSLAAWPVTSCYGCWVAELGAIFELVETRWPQGLFIPPCLFDTHTHTHTHTHTSDENFSLCIYAVRGVHGQEHAHFTPSSSCPLACNCKVCLLCARQ